MRKNVPKNAMTLPPEAKKVFEGIIYDVYHWRQKMFDGSYETFERLKRPDTVQILAVKDDKLVVQEQRQAGWSSVKYDIPGGRHDIETEDELQAAQRELREETGMVFKTWRLLDVVQPVAKIDWLVYTFLATDFEREAAPQLDKGEQITVMLMSLDEAKAAFSSEKGRHYPKELAMAQSLQDLLVLPEYKA